MGEVAVGITRLSKRGIVFSIVGKGRGWNLVMLSNYLKYIWKYVYTVYTVYIHI